MTLDGTLTHRVLADRRKEQHVALALMSPLVMRMCHLLRQRRAERRFPKQNAPRQALPLDGVHRPFRVGIQVRRPRWQGHPYHRRRVDDLRKRWTEFSTFPRNKNAALPVRAQKAPLTISGLKKDES